MHCQYKDVCKCPGGTDFEPVKGTQPGETGIRCLDFPKVFLPYNLAFQVRRKPGGRHIADAVEAMDKVDASRKKYRKSAAGKVSQEKWVKSDKGQKSISDYQKTEKYKLTQVKYKESEKGKKTIQKRKGRNKDFRKIQKWLRNHPGKTYEDYLKEYPDA